MKTTEERMKLLKDFLQDTLGEIPSWYQRFEKQWNDYQSGKDIILGHRRRYIADNGYFENKLWGYTTTRVVLLTN